MEIEEILNRLKQIIPDCEFRDPSSWSNKEPYICGYDSTNEISIQISFGKAEALGGEYSTFVIEYLGHTKMRKWIKYPSDSDYECYFYILQDLIDSSNRFREQIEKFPNFRTSDNRNYQIDKIFENV
jgi:hypothetical protein